MQSSLTNQELNSAISEDNFKTPTKRPTGRRRKNGETTLRGRLTKSPSILVESIWNANEILDGNLTFVDLLQPLNLHFILLI
jgi:hypothetical protein